MAMTIAIALIFIVERVQHLYVHEGEAGFLNLNEG
jgi:hypothetical protein